MQRMFIIQSFGGEYNINIEGILDNISIIVKSNIIYSIN